MPPLGLWMVRSLFFSVFLSGAFLLTGAAEAAWGHTHVNKAWAGDLTYLEVEQLTAAVEGVDPSTQSGYWTLVLLAVHHDAAGDLERSCELVAQFEPIKKWRKDMRLDALRGACLLEQGSLEEAAQRAGSAARAAAGSEPIDYVGILFRAHQVRSMALLRLVAANPDDPGNRKRARRALEAWERAARERNNPVALVLALAHKGDLPSR
jgi:hypothetical protein